LITNAQLRHETGKRSRAYAEQNFDAVEIARHLLNMYRGALEKSKVNA
jgi:hypothetical protein